MSVIKTEHLTHLYSIGTPFEKAAINDVNIEISQGEFVGVIGHTGSGKSTLIQHFNGLLKPTSGKIYLDGKDIWADKSQIRSVRFQVGLVFQYPEYQLFEETVYKDIAYGPHNMGLSDEEIDERVKNAAHFTGLTPDMLEKSPFDLSGGQKRRVAIAGVVAMDPEILVLDEPAAGLDPSGRNEILSGLVEYRKKRGNSLVIISHSMEDIAVYSDEIIAMSHGKVLVSGTPKEVFSQNALLTSSGLDIPQVTEVLVRLKKAGLPISDDKYTLVDAFEAVRALF